MNEYSQVLARVFNSRPFYAIPLEDRLALKGLFLTYEDAADLPVALRTVFDACKDAPAYYGAP